MEMQTVHRQLQMWCTNSFYRFYFMRYRFQNDQGVLSLLSTVYRYSYFNYEIPFDSAHLTLKKKVVLNHHLIIHNLSNYYTIHSNISIFNILLQEDYINRTVSVATIYNAVSQIEKCSK